MTEFLKNVTNGGYGARAGVDTFFLILKKQYWQTLYRDFYLNLEKVR